MRRQKIEPHSTRAISEIKQNADAPFDCLLVLR
jgi:hypothetical protein